MRQKAKRTAPVGLDTSVFDAVIDTGDIAACRQLAVELAQFLADPAAPMAERRAVVPAILRLSGLADMALRRDLAARLSRCQTLHADIVFTLAADDDEIALPFLATALALDSWRMLAILRVGDAARQATIARRGDLHPEVVTAIAGDGHPAAVAALLDNAACRLRPSDYRRIYERFTDEPEILDRLLERADLPPELRILHARQAAARISALLAERGWMAPQDAEAFLAEAEESAILRILEASEPRHLDRLMAFLSAKDMLHASLILRAACRGRMGIVERALSWLSSVPGKRVHALMAGQGSVALKAVFGAAGLPGASFPVFRAAIEAWRTTGRAAAVMAPEDFGRHVVEALMTGFPDMPGPERIRLLELVSRFTDGRTKALAHRLRDKVAQAA
ncbi:MAG: DUF2336 domain-containing protein [Hyphomicrobiales bacterium]